MKSRRQTGKTETFTRIKSDKFGFNSDQAFFRVQSDFYQILSEVIREKRFGIMFTFVHSANLL